MPDSLSRTTRPTRIEDVAVVAEVSVATVSRALRGLPNVAASTSERVHRVAAELGYHADPMASRLAGGRAKTVIVVVPHLASWYFSTVVAGAEAVCGEAGYDVLVTGVGSLDECARILAEAHRIERRADGIVLVNIWASDAQARSLYARGVALATVGTKVVGAPSVHVDDVAVGALAARTLTDLGHRRIGLITGRGADPLNFEVPVLRERGFARELLTVGLESEPGLVADGNFNIDGGQEALARLLDAEDPPTAVFAMSDEMAFGALIELENRTLRAGEDVSILGVDDHECSRVVGLSTIRQAVADQGASAARSLITAIGDPAADPSTTVSPTALILRSTTGPPPIAGT